MKNMFLYFSAFIPMYLLILVKTTIDLINKNIEVNILNILVLSLLSVLIVLGIIGLIWNIYFDKNDSETVVITSCENITDKHFLGYFSIFILFALSFNLTRISMFCLFVLIIIFIGIVYINNHLFYINPFLNILGFNFYEITYKKEGQNKEYTTKLFYRGTLIPNGDIMKLKLRNDHFSFVELKRKGSTRNE